MNPDFCDFEAECTISLVSVYPQLFDDDPEFINFKRSSYFAVDFYSLSLLGLLQISMFGTRAALYSAFNISIYFTVFLAVTDASILILTVIVATMLCERYHLQTALIERITSSWIFREAFDAFTVLVVVAMGIYLYARVENGQCVSETNIWFSQECNPVASAGSIPADTVLVSYCLPILAQLLFKGIRFRTVAICWAIATAFVTGAVISIRGWLQMYSILYSFFFLYISFEIERFMRVAYVQTLSVAAHSERERCSESIRRDQDFAAERARLELHILTIQGLHDKAQSEQSRILMELECDHLRTLIGNVAHDLKTPIQAISMGIELLRTECIASFTTASYSPRIRLSSSFSTDDESSSLSSSVLRRRPCEGDCSPPFNVMHSDMPVLPFDDLFQSMLATCRFMTMAVNRSIDFTKASSNIQLVPSLETVDYFETLLEPVDCIRILQSGVEVVVAPLPRDICRFVITDKHWLGENILCVLSNAVKYSSGGIVKVNTILSECGNSLRLQDDHLPLSADGTYFVRVTIIDSGIGISEEKRSNLFKPFQQAQRMAGGTGLGLYSLLKRMEALGGSCGIEARQDGEKGSVFWFTFPYRPDPIEGYRGASDEQLFRPSGEPNVVTSNAPWAIRRKALPEGLSASRTHVPLRIMIIEDSLSIVKITTRLLVTMGHVVESAINGSVGLNRLIEVYGTDDDFDMVLSDLQMPVMDGFEAVNRYRAYEAEQLILFHSNSLAAQLPLNVEANDTQTPLAPRRKAVLSLVRRSFTGSTTLPAPAARVNMAIVGMSANSDSLSTSAALAAGMNIFITKPFSGTDLQNILNLFDS